MSSNGQGIGAVLFPRTRLPIFLSLMAWRRGLRQKPGFHEEGPAPAKAE